MRNHRLSAPKPTVGGDMRSLSSPNGLTARARRFGHASRGRSSQEWRQQILGYRRFDLNFRAEYRASLAAFRSASPSRSRCAPAALAHSACCATSRSTCCARSACNAASRSACRARSASRVLFSAFSTARTFLIVFRAAACTIRSVSRSASAGSVALARNFSNAACLALAAASFRSRKFGR